MGTDATPTVGHIGELALARARFEYELRRGRPTSEKAVNAKTMLDEAEYQFDPRELNLWTAGGQLTTGHTSEPDNA